MIELSRNNLYKMMGDNREKDIGIPESFKELYRINYTILNKLENIFLVDKSLDYKDISDISYDEFISILSKNIFELEEMSIEFVDKSSLIKKLEELLKAMTNEEKKPQNIFNKIVKLLIEFSDKYLIKVRKQEFNDFIGTSKVIYDRSERYKKVFLSYAYDDLLYTLSLYVFFYQRKILLYVDWMHNGVINDGAWLKETLHSALETSDDLLFLRSINSELMISGGQYIRPWCSWETGNFFNKIYKTEGNKYFLNLYGKLPIKNLQLHGFFLLTNVSKYFIKWR